MKARYTHSQVVNVRTGMNGGLAYTIKHNYEHSAPMGFTAREDAYYRQNGLRAQVPHGRPITRRQERQLIRMERRNIAVHEKRRAKAVV